MSQDSPNDNPPPPHVYRKHIPEYIYIFPRISVRFSTRCLIGTFSTMLTCKSKGCETNTARQRGMLARARAPAKKTKVSRFKQTKLKATQDLKKNKSSPLFPLRSQ